MKSLLEMNIISNLTAENLILNDVVKWISNTSKPKHSIDIEPLWRNRLARSAVNRKVGGSNPPRGGSLFSLLYHDTNVKKNYDNINESIWKLYEKVHVIVHRYMLYQWRI